MKGTARAAELSKSRKGSQCRATQNRGKRWRRLKRSGDDSHGRENGRGGEIGLKMCSNQRPHLPIQTACWVKLIFLWNGASNVTPLFQSISDLSLHQADLFGDGSFKAHVEYEIKTRLPHTEVSIPVPCDITLPDVNEICLASSVVNVFLLLYETTAYGGGLAVRHRVRTAHV